MQLGWRRGDIGNCERVDVFVALLNGMGLIDSSCLIFPQHVVNCCSDSSPAENEDWQFLGWQLPVFFLVLLRTCRVWISRNIAFFTIVTNHLMRNSVWSPQSKIDLNSATLRSGLIPHFEWKKIHWFRGPLKQWSMHWAQTKTVNFALHRGWSRFSTMFWQFVGTNIRGISGIVGSTCAGVAIHWKCSSHI